MGQQQLLLVILSVIVVGIAISMGIVLFSTNAIEQKRNELINECSLLASEAQLYYKKPRSLGGGGKTFTGWTLPHQYTTTEVGWFSADVLSPNEVKITGTGNEIVTGSDSVKVELLVTSLLYKTTVIN